MRRRRWPLFLGILLFAGSLALPQVPSIQSNGWRSTLPMSIQIRMWETADSQTRSRIQYAYRNGQLSRSNTDHLRLIIQDALTNQNTPKPLLNEAVVYINLSLNVTKANPILTESDIASILSNPSLKERRLIMSYTHRAGIPASPELLQARRQLVIDPDSSISRDAIGWLLAYPSDDPEDAQTVRSFFTKSDDRSFWNFRNQFDRADPQLLQIPVSLLQHEDPAVRSRAAQCLSYVFSRTDAELSIEDSARILDLINDPNNSIQYHAMRLVEDLPISAEPLIDQILRNETNPEKLDSLIHSSIRRDPDPIGLTPAMVSISQNRSLPLRTRLDAADAYKYIRARARPDDQPQIMYPVYDDLVDALINNNFPAAFAYGQEIRSYPNPWALTAITRRMLDEGVNQNQINDWFTDRPGVAALLDFQHPSGITPKDQLRNALVGLASRNKYNAETIKAELKRALDTFYPDHTNSDPAP